VPDGPFARLVGEDQVGEVVEPTDEIVDDAPADARQPHALSTCIATQNSPCILSNKGVFFGHLTSGQGEFS
jgi:hypothetical protein